jgi:predicted ATPase
MATQQELQRLKDHWSRDPCYNLEDAEGFEQHRAELLAYSEQWKAQWKREWEERLVRKAEQGWGHEGIARIQQGIAAFRATGAELYRPYFLALLAEAHRKAEQVEKGLAVLAEALAVLDKTGERFYEAEL